MQKLHLKLRNRFGRGVDCQYFRINSRYGFKLFYGKMEAELSYNGQRFAATLGIAPRAFGFDSYIPVIDGKIDERYGRKVWGFFTEKVNVLSNIEIYCGNLDINRKFVKKKNKLVNKLMFCGYGYDLHPKNIGYKRGILMCIDYGVDSQF